MEKGLLPYYLVGTDDAGLRGGGLNPVTNSPKNMLTMCPNPRRLQAIPFCKYLAAHWTGTN